MDKELELTTKAIVPEVLNLPPSAQIQVIKIAKKTEIAVVRDDGLAPSIKLNSQYCAMQLTEWDSHIK